MTPKQQACLSFIREHTAAHGHSPSYEEMRQRLGVASKGNISRLVSGLLERGYLRREGGRNRDLIVCDGEFERGRAVGFDEGYRSAVAAMAAGAKRSRARPPGASKPGQKRAVASAGSFPPPLTCG